MRCNIKWLSIYIDGELSDKKKKKLEEHLKLCDSCSWQLQELKMLDAYAGQIKEPQISEAYWENFTSRVKNKLLIRESQQGKSRLWSGLKSLFEITPSKIKFATAIASVLVVALVGKLYINYQGIPESANKSSNFSNAPSEQKPLGMTDTSAAIVNQDKKETPKPAVKEDIQVPKHPVSTKSKLSAISKPEVSLSPSSVGNQKELAPNEIQSTPTSPVPSETVMVFSEQQKTETAQMRRLATESISLLGTAHSESLKTSTDSQGRVILNAPALSEFAPSEAILPKKVTPDSLSEIDSLRIKIAQLQELVTLISNDSILESTYLDLAQSYFNLCSLTKQKKDIEVALQKIDLLLKQYLFPDTRRQLTAIEQKLKGLQKSWE